MLFYIFITCLVVAGAVSIRFITGAVSIADSAFSDNQTDNEGQGDGGRIISLDNDNDNDTYTHMYSFTCAPTL